jgi:predicted ATPase
MSGGTRSISVRRRRADLDRERFDEPKIIGVRVSGYKSILKTCSIELAPLTLLAGANSSGKSSFFQPMLLVKQTLEAGTDPGPLLLDGPNVSFTAADEIFARRPGDGGVASSFGLRFDLSDERNLELRFGRSARDDGLVVPKTIISDPSLGINDLTIAETLSSRSRAALERLPKAFDRPHRSPSSGQDWDVTRRRCFLEATEIFEQDDFRYEVHTPLDDIVRDVEHQASGVIHVPGVRGAPTRVSPRTPVGSTFPGHFQDYVASIIHSWQTATGRTAKQEAQKLRDVIDDLSELRLTSNVKTVEVGDTGIELRVGRVMSSAREYGDDLVSIADVGLGMSQALPVVVALKVARPGQIVILEQPELHLHPSAQRALAGVLVRAAQRNVSVVVETHSSLLLRGVQTLVAHDEIPADLVSLNWFTRDPASGVSSVASARFDEAGRFGDWPEDFDDTVLQAEMDYLEAVNRRRSK